MRLKPLKKELAEEKQKNHNCGQSMFLKKQNSNPLNGKPNQMNHSLKSKKISWKMSSICH